jgi:hypothetical protein
MNAFPNVAPPDALPPKMAAQWRPEWREDHEGTVGVVPTLPAFCSSEASDQYAAQQMDILIHRLFFPGWPKPARQVVLLGAEGDSQTAAVCAPLVRRMAGQLPGTVCAIEASAAGGELGARLISSDTRDQQQLAAAHVPGAMQIEAKLWLLLRDSFLLREEEQTPVALRIQSRLSELRRQFDYTIVHAPAKASNLGILMAPFTDGVILVVQAHVTRRAAALNIKEHLQAANARLLGVVLAGRTFPIPEGIYKRL